MAREALGVVTRGSEATEGEAIVAGQQPLGAERRATRGVKSRLEGALAGNGVGIDHAAAMRADLLHRANVPVGMDAAKLLERWPPEPRPA